MNYLNADEIQKIGEALGLKGKFMVEWGTDHIFDILCPDPIAQTETREEPSMNIKKAVSIISRQAPCRHEGYELVGHSGEGKCNDCGAYFVINSNRHTVAAEKFDDAIDFLLSLDKEAPVLTETVEVKRWLHKNKVNPVICMTEPIHNMEDWIELTGTDTVEIKPKVKQREEMGTFATGYDARRHEGNKGIPDDAKLIFEWEE